MTKPKPVITNYLVRLSNQSNGHVVLESFVSTLSDAYKEWRELLTNKFYNNHEVKLDLVLLEVKFRVIRGSIKEVGQPRIIPGTLQTI